MDGLTFILNVEKEITNDRVDIVPTLISRERVAEVESVVSFILTNHGVLKMRFSEDASGLF